MYNICKFNIKLYMYINTYYVSALEKQHPCPHGAGWGDR